VSTRARPLGQPLRPPPQSAPGGRGTPRTSRPSRPAQAAPLAGLRPRSFALAKVFARNRASSAGGRAPSPRSQPPSRSRTARACHSSAGPPPAFRLAQARECPVEPRLRRRTGTTQLWSELPDARSSRSASDQQPRGRAERAPDRLLGAARLRSARRRGRAGRPRSPAGARACHLLEALGLRPAAVSRGRGGAHREGHGANGRVPSLARDALRHMHPRLLDVSSARPRLPGGQQVAEERSWCRAHQAGRARRCRPGGSRARRPGQDQPHLPLAASLLLSYGPAGPEDAGGREEPAIAGRGGPAGE